MLVKVSTFKRTVKFTTPGAEVDTMIPSSYVAEFEKVPPDEMAEMRAVPGGLKDHALMKRVLKSAGEASVEDVLSDPIASGAGVVVYFESIGDGIAGKNSKT